MTADDLPADTIAAMALWLLARGKQIRQHEAAADMLHGITHAVRHAQRTIDRPPSRVYAGPCPNCGADLLGWPGRTTIVCACGQPSVVAERQEAMRVALEDYLYTAADMARVLIGLGMQVKSDTIRKWVERGKLAPRPGGMLRVGDVVDVALDQRAKQAQRG